MFICQVDQPVVQTKYGKIRGYCLDGNYAFHGIRYAKARRFQMPEEPDAWDGVKDALSYGLVCPIMKEHIPCDEIRISHRFWPMSEDCQYLNIWTSTLEKGAKKPVMVWLHGGGFDEGSSIEHIAYDGENLSRYGDLVVVTLNHRLNILGYWDLTELGNSYWNTGNLGNADIVAALRWIQDNIEEFGGDPDNVTLFGQSGGGMKVWSLMQTPKANCLFQKGIIQSGVIIDHFDSDRETNHAMIEELKRRGFADGVRLETMPYEQLTALYSEIAEKLTAAGYRVVRAPLENDYYLGNPVKKGFCERAQQIPVIIGSVFSEFETAPEIAYKHGYRKEEIDAALEKRYNAAFPKLSELFAAAYPEKNRLDLMVLDSLIRYDDIRFIQERCKTRGSLTYSYLFNYEFAFNGGTPAWHCSDIPFFFHNTDKLPVCRDSEDAKILEARILSACTSFAWNGKPQIPGIAWPECTSGKEHVMIFDRKCEVRTNFDHELIRYHKENTLSILP